jgi:hypothetical protein
MAEESPRKPLIILAPYLPLREPLTARSWWIGPLAAFGGPWLNGRFEDLVRRLIAAYGTLEGDPIPNPALIVSAERGADGTWPSERERRGLQLALNVTVCG